MFLLKLDLSLLLNVISIFPLELKYFWKIYKGFRLNLFNSAAYKKVDLVEEKRVQAMNINCYSVKVLTDYCLKKNIPLVHISTDYVFNGNENNEYPEIPASNNEIFIPCNFYGFSKLEGERAVINSGCKVYIIRTSWVYNETGVNFVNTMIKLLMKEKM